VLFPIASFLSASFHIMPAPHRLTKSVHKTHSKTIVTTLERDNKSPSKLVVSAPKKSTGTGRKQYTTPTVTQKTFPMFDTFELVAF